MVPKLSGQGRGRLAVAGEAAVFPCSLGGAVNTPYAGGFR